jgi:hypothetical protein
MRKISGGSRSDDGSKTRLTLASLIPSPNTLLHFSGPPLSLHPKVLYPNSEQSRDLKQLMSSDN